MAVKELRRQEAAEALASLQHGRPPQAPNNNMPKSKEPITTQEYKRALKKCKNNKSADKDGLSAELVKLGGEAMETVFTKKFNRVLGNSLDICRSRCSSPSSKRALLMRVRIIDPSPSQILYTNSFAISSITDYSPKVNLSYQTT